MVKGLAKRVVVVKSPDKQLFEEAIFILKEDAAAGVSAQDVVSQAQRIAAENPNITAQVYDLNHFPDLREKYQVMSVPCLVVNGGEQVSFGKKNVQQLLELLSQ